MKQFKFFLTAMALLSWSAFESVSAHDLEIDGVYYAVTSSTSVSVTFKGDAYDSYADEYKGDVIIPEKVSYSDYNFTVTGIGERAFSGCPSITSISIPNGVTSIGEDALEGCTGTLTMNCDVPSVAESESSTATFYGGKFSRIIIGDEVKRIGDYAFVGLKTLTSLVVGKGVTWIAPNAFKGCTGELTVNYNTPSETFSLTNDQYYGGDFTKIIIGEDVSVVGIWEFSYLKNLSSVVIIGNSFTRIEMEAFRNCPSLSSVTFGNTIRTTGSRTFEDCHSLSSVTIGSSVERIETKAFSGCIALTKIAIPNSVTFIGGGAFESCHSLSSVTIGSSVENIGSRAFYNCSLSSIVVFSIIPPTCKSSTFSFVDKSLCVLNVPDGCIDAYRAAPVWSEFLTITGLDDVRTEYERPREVYNLRGEKVKTGLSVGEIGAGLPSGMYIMDGKKIMVK